MRKSELTIIDEQPSEYQFSPGKPDTKKIAAATEPDSGPVVGDLCPACGKDYLDYDGLLNLVCQNCGFTSGGCFT